MAEFTHPEQAARDDEDTFEIEVSSLDAPDHRAEQHSRVGWRPAPTPIPSPAPAYSPIGRYLTPRQRLQRAAVALMSVALACIILVAAVPALSSIAGSVVSRVVPHTLARPPAIEKNSNHYYFIPSVPWGSIAVDGRTLTHVPLVGDAHPLILPYGQHVIQWGASLFRTMHCTLTVPDADDDTCPLQQIYDARGDTLGVVFVRYQSLTTLRADLRTQLIATTTAALRNIPSVTTTVYPGERYLTSDTYAGMGVVRVTRPLRATLSVHLLLDAGYREPCAFNSMTDLCRAPMQNCETFCTLTEPSASAASASNAPTPLQAQREWLVAATAQSQWTYTALDGSLVAAHQPEFGFNLTLVVLRLVWDGARWYATPVFGVPGIPASNDVACTPARQWLAQGAGTGKLAVRFADIQQAAYRSAYDPGNGCAVEIASTLASGLTGPASTAPAHFLGRYGVLLAANDAAHTLWPELPQADAHERDVAENLLRLPH